MKFLLGAYLMTMLNTMLLLVSDAGWIAITSISASFFSLVGLVAVALINKKVNAVVTTTTDTNQKIKDVSSKVDGLLDEKTIADEEAGAKKERDSRDRQDAAENVGKLKAHEENKNTVTEVKQIKEVIVKAVEVKADETKKLVEEVPDKVIEKLPPK